MKTINVVIDRDMRNSLFNIREVMPSGLVKELYEYDNIKIHLAADIFPYIVLEDVKSNVLFSLGVEYYDRFKNGKNLMKYWTIESWNTTVHEYIRSEELKEDVEYVKNKFGVFIKVWFGV